MSDRKYRHRGYQDDDDRDRGRQAPKPRGEKHTPRLEGAPRGRGVGLPGAPVFKCSNCGQQARELSSWTTSTTCSGCGKALRTCTNCSFFNPAARFECKKPLEARVENKTKANDCSMFQPKTIRDLKQKSPETPGDARSAFDALFKK